MFYPKIWLAEASELGRELTTIHMEMVVMLKKTQQYTV